jgi:hypothetical protein
MFNDISRDAKKMRERSQRVATLSDIGTIEASQSLHPLYHLYWRSE